LIHPASVLAELGQQFPESLEMAVSLPQNRKGEGGSETIYALGRLRGKDQLAGFRHTSRERPGNIAQYAGK
jgi:hypothetical protein